MVRSKWAHRILWLAAGIGIGFFVVSAALYLWWLHGSYHRLASNPNPELALSDAWWEGGDYPEHEGIAVARGSVENISEETLGSITVVVTFWSAVHNIVDTGRTQLKGRALRPGDRTEWEVRVPWKGAMTGGGTTMRFEDASGRDLPYVDMR